jgi:hypothetical protein
LLRTPSRRRGRRAPGAQPELAPETIPGILEAAGDARRRRARAAVSMAAAGGERRTARDCEEDGLSWAVTNLVWMGLILYRKVNWAVYFI